MKRWSQGSITRRVALLLGTVACGLGLAQTASAVTVPLVYVPLTDSCRILDTRVAGSVSRLSSTSSPYTFGSRDGDIETAYQSGSATGCGIPTQASAISVYFNSIGASRNGNLSMWPTTTTTPPSGGAGVYNPVSENGNPTGILYNTGFQSLEVNPADGKFYVAVSNGDTDLTINAVGYWITLDSVLPASSAIAYTASTSVITPTTILGGVAGVSPVMPVSGATLVTLPTVTVASNTIDITSLLAIGGLQEFPEDGTFTSVKGTYFNTVALSLVGSTVTVTATLYQADPTSPSATTATATGLSCSVSYTGVISALSIKPCTPSGSATVQAGKLGLWVFTASATGLSLVNTLPMTATLSLAP